MRIVQYIGGSGTWGDVGPDALEKGIGGRESALIHLASAWSEQGHEVVNLVPRDYVAHYETDAGGRASYVPLDASGPILRTMPSDVTVSWEDPSLFADEMISAHAGLRVLEMQVAHTHLYQPDSVDKDPFIDVYAVLSGWAGEYLASCNSNLTESKIEVLPNGVDSTRWPEPDLERWHRPPFRFWYSSSPDRGLHHLLKLWPRFRERWPGSELHIAYGLEWAEKLKWSHNGLCERALDVIEGVKQDGVFYHGRIGQRRLARIQAGCHALLYPADTLQPTETGCITIVEAMRAGKPVFTTDCDCIPSEFGGAASITSLPWLGGDSYFEEVARVMEDPDAYRDMAAAGLVLASQRDWADIASSWIEMIVRRSREKREQEDASDAETGADSR